jgi:hypothetical protein
MDLPVVPMWVDTIVVSFGLSGPDGTVTLDYASTNAADLLSGIAAAHAKGQTVILSVGGISNCANQEMSQDTYFGASGINNYNSFPLFLSQIISLKSFYLFNLYIQDSILLNMHLASHLRYKHASRSIKSTEGQ